MLQTQGFYIELLIAGAGTCMWMVLAAIDIFGYDWIPIEYFLGEYAADGAFLGITILLFPFFYVCGIITDRISDWVFDTLFEDKMALKAEKKFREEYDAELDCREAKFEIYGESRNLKELYEYGRMRSRIARDWTLNSAFLIVAFNYFFWFSSFEATTMMRIKLSLFMTFLLGVSTVVSYLTWKGLTTKEYKFLAMHWKKKHMPVAVEA